MGHARKLPRDFYVREDVVQIGRELLGKVLCTDVDGILAKAIITETEAYAGVGDRASHAYGGRRTDRTAPMYARGGIAYVYLCYGIHHLFNVVTSRSGVSLQGERVWIEDHDVRLADDVISVSARIGIDYAGEDVSRPYRFAIPQHLHAAMFRPS